MPRLHMVCREQLLGYKFAIRQQHQEKEHLDQVSVDTETHCNPIHITSEDERANG